MHGTIVVVGDRYAHEDVGGRHHTERIVNRMVVEILLRQMSPELPLRYFLIDLEGRPSMLTTRLPLAEVARIRVCDTG